MAEPIVRWRSWLRPLRDYQQDLVVGSIPDKPTPLLWFHPPIDRAAADRTAALQKRNHLSSEERTKKPYLYSSEAMRKGNLHLARQENLSKAQDINLQAACEMGSQPMPNYARDQITYYATS
jgi:hypothetical protein